MKSYIHNNKVFILFENNKQLQIGTIKGGLKKYIKLDPKFVFLLTLKALLDNNINELSEDLFLDIVDSLIETMKNRIYYRSERQNVIEIFKTLEFIYQCDDNLIINSKVVNNVLNYLLRTKDGSYINKIFLDNGSFPAIQDISGIVQRASEIAKYKNLIPLVVRETKYGCVPSFSLIILLFLENKIEKQEWRQIFKVMVFELINKMFSPKSPDEKNREKEIKKLKGLLKEYKRNVDELCELSDEGILNLCKDAKQKINPIVLESFMRYCIYILKYGERIPTYNEIWDYLIEEIKKGNLPLFFNKSKKPQQQIIYTH